MKYRKLGDTGINLPAIGLGCMGMSIAYGPKDDAESVKVLERSLDLGINFWDTADVYGFGHNEELISRVLVPNRDKIFIATKFGFRLKEGGDNTTFNDTYLDCSPSYIKTAVEKSLKRLKIETIDLYYAHRVDPNIPIEETVGVMSDLVKEGKVKYIGLSEASAASIRKAHAVHPVTALQSEFSLLTRNAEGEILDTCRELGITFIPFSPLSRGLMTATVDISNLPENDFRKTNPRFSSEHWENNNALANAFAEFAHSKNCTPAQLAIAWVLSQGEDVIPIPGTKRTKYLEENAKAVDVNLSQDDLEDIDELLNKYPNIGERYTAQNARLVNK